MTLCMKITVTIDIVLLLRYLPFFHNLSAVWRFSMTNFKLP
jgi:hypothetical protein